MIYLHGARAHVSGQQTRTYIKCRRQGYNRELLRCADAVCVCDCNEMFCATGRDRDNRQS